MQTPRQLSRRTVVAATAAGLVATVVSPARAAETRAARFHTVGRVRKAADGTVRYSWPGISFEGRFHGTGVGVVLDDADNDYDVQVDGTTVATLVTPGRTVSWIDGLPDGGHRVRVVKRTESPWAAGRFGGFVAAPGGAILARPRARTRQIEFIGDSYTAGYGNVSGTQDCSGNGGVNRNSNADLTFGALTARKLDADHQINAFSGRGMVRNYNGGDPGTDFRTYYDRALLNVEGDVWRKPDSWRPQVVVVGLGINDFSTPLNPGERWSTTAELVAAYESAFHGFLDKLRARYGRRTFLVVAAAHLWNTTAFTEATRRIVEERGRRGDGRVSHWYYDDPGLDHLGCDWHPSLHDHRIISGLLDDHLAGLSLRW
ncbi:SGNH/GDSL hydrolase family protein [Streptomyces europaeiscabiei]|uniref:SGNH/GDSL hydrolase family protein n=1 Tax=Streptomyces europaeiscabiei TaxID=146819 RepID=A0ABU4NNX0_9ACTN|nr:SGNH/GDSL hydrolase family protein [Streptomyces europaeiscabiei]MDX2529144.1 SGNH/GDSL hydrolase family protein [Streptomyces europaeiscabiei]MDX2763073.1 SGNH/GDSL hydrolase family protein [Streptomyces europaeiscabiei]MDX3546549.1 SGNH/GDSL hydrolase family protein [Streptomyces europaeiscabiei]MDX3556243.1 SGNH/GDSL hydrolase family protein [Streptomyces europaeiscabiei]MDX3703787.1 SGNH/GDSL hydrolase family protein [Streptomyces europaeiscabiei]